MKAKNKKQQKTSRKSSGSRQRASYWVTMSAVGSVMAYSAAGVETARPVYAGPLNHNEPARVPAQNPSTHRFDIPAGALAEVMESFQKITGLSVVLARDGLAELPSPGVRGDYTADRALQQILAGAGLAYRYTASQTVTIDLQSVSTSVDVTTSAPGTAVSSPRYTATLRDIPQTVEVIPQAVLQEQGAVTLSDALRNVPGVTMQAGEGGGASNTSGDMFNMRGFNASNSIFVDGVRDDGLMSRNVFNLEQVEVFMGPTGSDVGRGTAAGYVNMQTKVPHLRPVYSGTFAYDNEDQKRGSIDLNQNIRLGPQGSWWSRAAARLNALWQQGGVAGRNVVEVKNRSIAPSIAVGLGTPTRLTFAAQVTRQNNQPDYGVPTAAWRDEPLAATTVLASQPVAPSNYYGSIGYDFDKTSQHSYTARVEHDVNENFTLRYQARYNETHRTAIITGIGAFFSATETVALQRQGNDRRNQIVSNQATSVGRFSTGRFNHALSAGAEYLYEDQFAPALGGVGTRGPVSIYNPNPNDVIADYAPAHTGAYNKGWTNTVAVYAFDTIELSRRWQLSGGMRWERYTTNFRSVNASGATTTDLRASDDLVSVKAGLLFRVTDSGNVYFGYGSTLTPPGTANFTLSAQPANANNPNVDPQESRNYEVGTKWGLWRSRLLVNFAAFHTDNENVIFTVDANASPPIFNYDDKQRVKGVTLGMIGQITDRLQVIANLGYLDSENLTQNPAIRGKRLTLTPRNSGSLWATYRLPFRLTVGGGVRYTDATFANAANTIKIPASQVADAVVEYAVNDNLTLRVNVYNLTNETYVRNVNNNGNRYNPGAPRSAMFTTNFRF